MSIITKFIKENKNSNDSHIHKISASRTADHIPVMKYRLEQIYAGKLMPTEEEWALLANYHGGLWKKISYEKLLADFNSSDVPSRFDSAIADDASVSRDQSFHRREVPSRIAQ